MEFMNQVNKISKIVGKTAADTYNTVADKSGKVIEDAKLRMTITEKESDIEIIYEEIGKTVYDSYKAGEDVGKVFTKEAKKLDKLILEIKEMNQKILLNKGMRNCSSCGEVIANESTFCQNCGEKQKPIKLKTEKEKKDEVKKEENKEKVCAQCGLVCEPKSKFCPKCGYAFEK